MLEIGTSTHAIAGFGAPSKPFRQALEEMAECGFQHFLLLGAGRGPCVDASGDAPMSLVDILGSDRRALLRAVAAHGLRISCLYPGIALDFSAEGWRKTTDALLEFREAAWELGCHVMVHSAGVAAQARMPFAEKKEAIEWVARAMDTVASDTPGQVFRMAVDVHYHGIIETVADCRHLLSCCTKRNAGICLNMGHMTTLGEPGWTLLEGFPERMHVLAWKDHLLGPDLPRPVVSVELGTGRTPFERYTEVCRRARPQGLNLITFEDVALEERKDALSRSREHLLGLLRTG